MRGFEVVHILKAVARTEQRLNWGPGPAPATYHRLGYWLVQPRYLRTCLKHLGVEDSGIVIPLFSMKPWTNAACKVLKRYEFFTRFQAAAAADVVCVKNNIRAFYVDRSSPVTTKVLLSKSRNLSHLRNDVEIRSRVVNYGTVNLPRIIDCDLEFDPPFICEELVFGRRFNPRRDSALLAESFFPQWWRTYEKHGFHFKKFDTLCDTRDAANILERLCATHEWEGDWMDRDQFVTKAVELLSQEPIVTCTTGHGDLCLANLMLSTKGDIYVLDWECSKEMPVIGDLLKLILDVPHIRELVEKGMDCLARQHVNIRVVPFRAQLFLAIVAHLLSYGRAKPLLKPRKFTTHLAEANALLQGPTPLI